MCVKEREGDRDQICCSLKRYNMMPTRLFDISYAHISHDVTYVTFFFLTFFLHVF